MFGTSPLPTAVELKKVNNGIMADEKLTEDEEIRNLRQDVVQMRRECPKVIAQLMEQARQQQLENMKNAEYLIDPVQKVEKKPDFWMPSMKSFEIAEPKHSLEKQIELNARCDELLEGLKMLKEAKKKSQEKANKK